MRTCAVALALLAVSHVSSSPIPDLLHRPTNEAVLPDSVVERRFLGGGYRVEEEARHAADGQHLRWSDWSKEEQHEQLGKEAAVATIVIGGLSGLFGWVNAKGVKKDLRDDYKRKLSLKLWRDYCIKSGSQSEMCKMKQVEQFRGL